MGAAGILLADSKRVLHVVAASSEQVRLLELFQLQNMEGPCLDCFTTGTAIVNEDLAQSDRWPRFGPEALSLGYRSVQALPLRLRDLTIGALNVFVDDRVVVTETDLLIAQALADAATIAILQDQATRESQLLVSQLNYALNSRITIEQAKGVLAERARIDMDTAFARLAGLCPQPQPPAGAAGQRSGVGRAGTRRGRRPHRLARLSGRRPALARELRSCAPA